MSSTTSWISQWDEIFERWSDRLNPLVVREVRQSFKNRRMIAIFFLLLAACWFASAVLIVNNAGNVEFYELGPLFLGWYLVALIACLMIATPTAAFFSMVQEFRDNAFEVLAVTTLTPNRIVLGKIQGSLVMMILYSSAVAPFVCLSYMLGGLGIVGLFLGLVLLFSVSLAMTLFGVMLGSLAKKPWIEVLNLMILLFAAMIVSGISYTTIYELNFRVGLDLGEMLIGLCCAGMFLGFVALISFGVAQAQLTTTFLPLDYRRDGRPIYTAQPPWKVTSSTDSPKSAGE